LPSMSIDDAELSGNRGPSLSAVLNAVKVAWLFEGAPESLGNLLEMATASKPLPRFPLNVTFRARTKVEKTKLASQNVCGLLAGSKPVESVVLSAHIDHLGADPNATGTDKIYNGAMDNASGIATLIETARALKVTKPLRSLVFVAVTAEEKGLLGSRYFANRAPAAAGTMVADINFDMYLPIHAMKKIMAFGLEESSLRKPLEEVTGYLGLGLTGDLEPHRNRFIRSDQYSFIQRGIPALALKVGYDSNTPEAELQKQWTANRYHALADDLSQPVDFETAVKFNRVVRELAVAVANAPERPNWNESSFFRRFAAPQHEAVSGGRD
jgi:Zn-dependent M28 family amino/carboxypeptidase